jgi:hypothetical protein
MDIEKREKVHTKDMGNIFKKTIGETKMADNQ